MQTYLKTKPVWMQLLLFLGLAFGIVLVLYIIGTAVLSGITGISSAEMGNANQLKDATQRALVIRGQVLMQFLGLFLLPSLLFAYYADPNPAQYLGLKKPSKMGYWVVAIALLFITLPLVEYTGLINKKINFGPEFQSWSQSMEERTQETIQFMLSLNSVGDLLLNLIFIAGFAAVGEELFFRGILQRLFIKSTKNPSTGIIIAAFFFSFFHFQFFGFIPRFLLGIVLGAIYWYSGSLYTAIAAHFVYDAAIIIVVYLNPQMLQNPDATMMNQTYLGIAALLSAVVTGTLIWWMKKASVADYNEVYADEEDGPTPNDFSF